MSNHVIALLLASFLLVQSADAILIGSNLREQHIPSLCDTSLVALPSDQSYLLCQIITSSQQVCLRACFGDDSCTSIFTAKLGDSQYRCVLSSARYQCDRLAGAGQYKYFVVRYLYPYSCGDVQSVYGQTDDSEYCIATPGTHYILSYTHENLDGTHIYCKDMSTDSPREYLTLPSGETNNYSSTRKDPPEPHGRMTYTKIGLDLSTMTVDLGDESFATGSMLAGTVGVGTWIDSYPRFGKAFSCTYYDDGEFSIDLTGTGFYVPSTVTLATFGYQGNILSFSPTDQVLTARCTGFCGGCIFWSLTLEYNHDLASASNQCNVI